MTDFKCLYNKLSCTYEGQDAEAEVVCNRGDDGTHPQNSERGVTAGDDEVTGEVPEHVPAQQVTLLTAQAHRTHVTTTYKSLSDPQTQTLKAD